MKKQEKDKRNALLIQQRGLCALCGDHIPTVYRMYYVESQNAIICKSCGLFRHVISKNAKRGLTPQVLAAFHAREPAPDPVIKAKAKTKPRIKLSPAQLQSRQMVIDGRIPGVNLEEWERRIGIQGTDYAEQYGLDTPTDADTGTSTDTGPETLIVDGERCMAVNGEWVPVDQIEQSSDS